MMPGSHYDLFAVLESIRRNIKRIISITMLAIALGIVLYVIIPRKYKAETILILKNPLYADRNNMYNTETKFLDYAANDEDMDRLFSMASSDSLQNNIIHMMHLAAAYDFDSSDAEEVMKLKKYFKRHLSVTKNEFKNIVIAYSDKDAIRAATIANTTAGLLEYSLRDFYNGMRRNMYQSVMKKVNEEDSAIKVLTDSLVVLRERYGIYDIISPARYNIMLSNLKENGHAGFARGVELIQNVEAVKDELVSDKAKHITLANQYATGTEINEMHLAHIIQAAKPPLKHWFGNLAYTVLVSAFLGFFMSVVYVLLSAYYRHALANRS